MSTAPLLALPAELHTQILSETSFPDLCAFRRTCSSAASLLSHGEILRQWTSTNISAPLKAMHPPSSSPSLAYVHAQVRRETIAAETSSQLASWIQSEYLHNTLKRFDVFPDRSKPELYASFEAHLRAHLHPLLLTLQNYFESTTTALLSQTSDPTTTLRALTTAFQSSLPESHLRATHKLYLFLAFLTTNLLASPNTPTPASTSNSSRISLLLNGISTLQPLLSIPTATARRENLGESLAALRPTAPETSSRWTQAWRDGSVPASPTDEREPHDAKPTVEQARALLAMELAPGDLWVDGARRVIGDKRPMNEVVGSAWQGMDFLCDVVGYDVLVAMPSMGGPF